ncbi:heme ABC transporter ATP-binding protein [Fulvivirgaceae bacterium BMA10]|uniref:Heme ABC transporter ATP-binding protein n=1 Tax=Splendidivirga corallicola TaxID=3051826 RepID=A0ABT8KZ04_9BACT|nr:heme ABC transporter ATP-binding protein [Fulvivirgaceae bacterium BMA10]
MYIAKDISYKIGGKAILENISITIPPGSLTAIVGPNGAGKTTLLKILTGEYSTKNQNIFINQVPIQKLGTEALSKIRAVVPQSAHVNFPFTVEEIVALGRYPHKKLKATNAEIIDSVMHITEIAALKDRIYMTLSGGEKQRVQLARALAQIWERSTDPSYLFLDEPTANLDIAQQHQIFEHTKRMCGSNVGILMIIHDLNLAAQYADHLIYLKQGSIVAQGPAEFMIKKHWIEETFSYPVDLVPDRSSGRSYIIPRAKFENNTETNLETLIPIENGKFDN